MACMELLDRYAQIRSNSAGPMSRPPFRGLRKSPSDDAASVPLYPERGTGKRPRQQTAISNEWGSIAGPSFGCHSKWSWEPLASPVAPT